MDDARNTMESAGRGAASMANDFGRRAKDVADKVADKASDMTDRASDWMREQKIAENATSYVVENPAKAIGIAVAAGAILALLFSRRRQWP